MPSSTMEHSVFNDLESPTCEEIINCSFSKWYALYKDFTLTKVKIIKPLPQSFIDYLTSDGIKLPGDDSGGHIWPNSDNEYSDWEGEEQAEEEEEVNILKKNANLNPIESFQKLHDELKQYVKSFNYKFTPKLNWSAPKDATWILMNNTLKCTSVNDLYLVLNASNYIMHDITNAFDEVDGEEKEKEIIKEKLGFEYELILREWFDDFNPALEFRCFVKNRSLIAISQRDLNYYDYLITLYDKIYDSIVDFFEKNIQTSFPNDNFVFDIYFQRSLNKVFLIDINPFVRSTDPLLFTWHEITLLNPTEKDFKLDFRIVDKVNAGRFASKEHSENQVPKDVVDASLGSSTMSELASSWQKLMQNEKYDNTSSDDDNDNDNDDK
ncbi:hypothetical protein PACTADRAFT_51565 [Pachysolen tannophilus NRRL Y-2460]|uniref:Uncharacterized protein n=1 Tax=Pachysolen tannophilus NRRL Y-2460 TaxID=669874 RepID=A0A1E4TPX8_PACTA|nr:hypothetical protein PACTADRAFT_51565 [Pachysolen tannophilus NRRL Y-2460]